MLMNTKTAVQGLGYNVKHYLFDDSRPVIIDEVVGRVWLFGELVTSTTEFYSRWSRIHRMTYRRHWPDPLLNPRTSIVFDSDTGWGCTIRSCQMMVSHALLRIGLPESRVLPLFADRETAFLSVHSFVNSQTDKFAGEWFGPSSVSLVLRRLLSSPQAASLGLGIVVSLDGVILTTDVIAQSRSEIGASLGSSVETPPMTERRRANSWDFCGPSPLARSPPCGFVDITNSECVRQEFWVIDESKDEYDGVGSDASSPSSESSPLEDWRRPVLVVVAVRLSPDSELSGPQIAALLWYSTLPSFCGILGGPDRRCHFIVGLAEEGEYTLLSIDPHIVQEAGEGGFSNAAHPTRLAPACLCPSLAVGFLVRNQAELDRLREQTATAGAFVEVRDAGAAPPRRFAATVVHESEEPMVLLDNTPGRDM